MYANVYNHTVQHIKRHSSFHNMKASGKKTSASTEIDETFNELHRAAVDEQCLPEQVFYVHGACWSWKCTPEHIRVPDNARVQGILRLCNATVAEF